VSIKLMPSSIPKRSASISKARAPVSSPMRHVPSPSAGTRLPSGSATVLTLTESHLEGGNRREPSLQKIRQSPRRLNAECGRKIGWSPQQSEDVFPLVRDCAESFDQRLAFCAIVDHECIVFSVRRPRAAWHFFEIREPPVGDVSWFQS
jgi:hypothetical protein